MPGGSELAVSPGVYYPVAMRNLCPWKEFDSGKLADCRIFNVTSSDRETADGKKGTFYLVNAPDWAGVSQSSQ